MLPEGIDVGGSSSRIFRWLCPDNEASDIASTPSGIMTISDVPTSSPMPILDISRSCACDSVMERGSAPARKELIGRESVC